MNFQLENGSWFSQDELNLDKETSEKVFKRSGEVTQILIELQTSMLRL